MVIRNVRNSDLPEIEQLISTTLYTCVTDKRDVHGFLLNEICKGLEWWKSNEQNCFVRVAESDEQVIGFIMVREFWSFSDLFVLPDIQNSGVGRALVELAFDECREKSPKGKLMLNSSEYAKGFYEKMGFVQSGEPRDLPGGCYPFEYDLVQSNKE